MTDLKRIVIALAGAAALHAQTVAAVPQLEPLERRINALIQKYRLPGASFALAHEGKLVYARGFGIANREKNAPVQPHSLFRIASVSKPVTAVTLLKLQEDGKLSLDDRVFDILGEYQPVLRDSRMREITVRQLLNHTGGWDPSRSGDPLFPDRDDILSAGGSLPPSADQVIGYWLQRPLDFAPGTAYAYSNFGYLLAGRVIEKVTGMAYGDAVRRFVLAPQGVTHMRLARSLTGRQAPDEVQYYDVVSRRGPSIFSATPEQVPAPYGTFSIELADSAGGWIASAPELVRLLTALNGTRGNLLTADSMRQFLARPAGLRQQGTWYGLGISVAPADGGYNFIHDGAIPGTHALAGSFASGIAFAFLTNTNPGGTDASAFDNELAVALVEGIAAVRQWPQTDGFPALFPGAPVEPEVRAVVNAASLETGALSPGEVVSLAGVGLGSQVFFDGTAAPILYSDDKWVNAVVPFDVAGKSDVAVTVARGEVWSPPLTTPVAVARPAAFTNGGFVAAINQDGTLHGGINPAARGSVVALYLTGLGKPAFPAEDGQIEKELLPCPGGTRATVGDQTAVVEYCGTAPGLIVGVWQMNVRIPADAPAGTLPLRVYAGDVASASTPKVAVR